MSYPKIILKPQKDQSLRRFHPWVFSGAIQKIKGVIQEGDVVEVYTHNEEFLGMGHYQIGSIAVRIFSFIKVLPDYSFWKKKIQEAYALRQQVGLAENAHTNVFRLVNAEGDGMPGLIVDFYNGTAVIQTHSIGMHYIKTTLADVLKEVLKDKLQAVYDKSEETMPHKLDIDVKNGLLWGSPTGQKVLENGHLFWIDWETGQKTGFFIDQRDNRKLLSEYCEGKTVLNTFCYSGGFSVYTVKAGAREVYSVDSSRKAIALTEKNMELNKRENQHHEAVTADVFSFIEKSNKNYDIIILDPPAFAKHQKSKHNAIKGYKRLNAEAIKKVNSGGILFTFSCSQVIDRYLFNHTILSAAIQAKRNVNILHHLSQPPDHPVSVFHPEGEYLKGLVLHVS